MKQPRPEIVLLMSGGLDSVVLAYELARKGKSVRILYLDFGKPVSRKELGVAKLIAHFLNVPLEVVGMGSVSDMMWGYVPSAVFYQDELDSKGWLQPVKVVDDRLPTQLTSARRDRLITSGFHVLLSISSFYSQMLGARSVFLALIKEQFDAHKGLRTALNLFVRHIQALNPKAAYDLQCPFNSKDKADVVRLGNKLRVPMELTWSCLLAGPVHCGECEQCKSRIEAFKEARVVDKTPYSSSD